MERNKWEIAIRCLEVALHPNTGDEEVIAAGNGFRRTAGGTALTEMVAALAGPPSARRLAKLTQVNRDLAKRLDAAAQKIASLEAKTLAAQARAVHAEKQFTELRAAHAALVEQRRAPRPIAPARLPFQEMLAAALGQGSAAPAAVSLARFPWRA
jgi:hypothetical protein